MTISNIDEMTNDEIREALRKNNRRLNISNQVIATLHVKEEVEMLLQEDLGQDGTIALNRLSRRLDLMVNRLKAEDKRIKEQSCT